MAPSLHFCLADVERPWVCSSAGVGQSSVEPSFCVGSQALPAKRLSAAGWCVEESALSQRVPNLFVPLNPAQHMGSLQTNARAGSAH